mmetsp:Transcript_30767/g.61753  ORF Transcript_30767/g.61753 Transcript_30767/m.61753 type:complete len:235 (+) Transcript_30767:1650-2354(+)
MREARLTCDELGALGAHQLAQLVKGHLHVQLSRRRDDVLARLMVKIRLQERVGAPQSRQSLGELARAATLGGLQRAELDRGELKLHRSERRRGRVTRDGAAAREHLLEADDGNDRASLGTGHRPRGAVRRQGEHARDAPLGRHTASRLGGHVHFGTRAQGTREHAAHGGGGHAAARHVLVLGHVDVERRRGIRRSDDRRPVGCRLALAALAALSALGIAAAAEEFGTPAQRRLR